MKKKIILLSLSTPTFNNVRAASALPYHLIKGMREDSATAYDVEIYSYNINDIMPEDLRKVESELGVTVHLLPRPAWQRWMLRLRLLALRVLLPYPLLSYFRLPVGTVGEIREKRPDGIWIYGEELMGLARNFADIPCVVTMPDCESLFYHRMLSKGFATVRLLQTLRYAYAFHQYRKMERDHYAAHVQYHFVGDADARFFKLLHPEAHAHFLRHPLYEHKPVGAISFHQPKLKALIAGRNDLYMHEATSRLVDELCGSHGASLPEHLAFTFLGRGWEAEAARLVAAGYDAQVVGFAPDYIAELQQHDLQITPIVVGTGTKGKVLDAIANGLLEIGTHGALENIAVESGRSCVQYETAAECVDILADIAGNVSKYEAMAMEGVRQVCAQHERDTVARGFVQLFTLSPLNP